MNDQFETCLDRKTTTMGQKTRQSNLLHGNAPAHKAKSVRDTIKVLDTFQLPFVFIDGKQID